MSHIGGSEAFNTHVASLAASLDRLDYYTLLGLSSKANADEVKRAYHRVAALYHPDTRRNVKSGTQEELNRIFKRMTEAYRVLHSYERRRRYDTQLAQGGSARLAQDKREKTGPRSPDADLKTSAGKRCFMQALGAIKRKDYKAAKRDLQLALTYEGPSCQAVKDKLNEVKAQLGGK